MFINEKIAQLLNRDYIGTTPKKYMMYLRIQK